MRVLVCLLVAGVSFGWSQLASADEVKSKKKLLMVKGVGAKLTISPGNAGRGIHVRIIRRYLRRAKLRLGACHSHAGISRHKEVRLAFAIAPSGRVVVAKAVGKYVATTSCVERIIKSIKFPRPKDNVTVPVFFKLSFVGGSMGFGTGAIGTTRPGGLVGRHGGLWGRWGPGRGKPVLRRSMRPTLRLLRPVRVQGSLDKAIVRRYLHRNRRKAQYCYERRLLVKPNLGGLVRARFMINPQGVVAAAKVQFADSKVAKCVESILRAIKLPKPKGGGIVQVRFRWKADPGYRVRGGNGNGLVMMPGFRARILSRTTIGGRYSPHHTVRANARRIAGCYTRYVRKRKGVRGGKVRVAFSVKANGKPHRLSAWGLGPVAGCVAYVMRQLMFAPGKVDKIQYEISFGRHRRRRPRPNRPG